MRHNENAILLFMTIMDTFDSWQRELGGSHWEVLVLILFN